MKSDLKSHILEVINSAIDEKILPSIENVIANKRETKNTKWDLRSDGRHPDRNIQMTQNSDLESAGRHKSKFCQQTQDSGENFPKLIATSSNQNNHCRENPSDFEQSDDDGYDTYTITMRINLKLKLPGLCSSLFVIRFSLIFQKNWWWGRIQKRAQQSIRTRASPPGSSFSDDIWYHTTHTNFSMILPWSISNHIWFRVLSTWNHKLLLSSLKP